MVHYDANNFKFKGNSDLPDEIKQKHQQIFSSFFSPMI